MAANAPDKPGPVAVTPVWEPGLHAWGILGALGAVLAWVALFGAGMVVDSGPFREKVLAYAAGQLPLGTFDQWVDLLRAAALVLLTYTPTNVAVLCCTASLLGIFGRQVTLHDESETESPPDQVNPYTSAIIRGFLVYLVLISGLLIITESPFAAPTPGQYVRLAGLLSLLSFLFSYNSRLFGKFLKSCGEAIENRTGGADRR